MDCQNVLSINYGSNEVMVGNVRPTGRDSASYYPLKAESHHPSLDSDFIVCSPFLVKFTCFSCLFGVVGNHNLYTYH